MPVIVKCDVVSEKENEIERVVEFQEGRGPGGKVREVCKLYAPAKVSYASQECRLLFLRVRVFISIELRFN